MRFSHFFAKAPANLCSRVAFLEELNCIDIQKLAKSNRLLGYACRKKRTSPTTMIPPEPVRWGPVWTALPFRRAGSRPRRAACRFAASARTRYTSNAEATASVPSSALRGEIARYGRYRDPRFRAILVKGSAMAASAHTNDSQHAPVEPRAERGKWRQSAA
jgi:hypothetical protein